MTARTATTAIAVLFVVVLASPSTVAAAPATVKVVADAGQDSVVHFSESGGNSDFSLMRTTANVPEASSAEEGTAALLFTQGGQTLLEMSNGVLTVHTDLHLPDHGSLSDHLDSQVNATEVAAQEHAAALAAIDGIVNEQQSTLEAHAGHFDTYLSALELLRDVHPWPGVTRKGARSYTVGRSYHATVTASISGTRHIDIIALRQIEAHWGALTYQCDAESAYYYAGMGRYRGGWGYGNTEYWTKWDSFGTEHGTLSVVDHGVVTPGAEPQYDIAEKFIRLTIAEYTTVHVQCTVTTTYGHHFSTYDKADPNWTGAIYLYNNEDHADLWTETAIGESLTLV